MGALLDTTATEGITGIIYYEWMEKKKKKKSVSFFLNENIVHVQQGVRAPENKNITEGEATAQAGDILWFILRPQKSLHLWYTTYQSFNGHSYCVQCASDKNKNWPTLEPA